MVEKGDHILEENNKYPQSRFNGIKSIVLTTVIEVGGNNTFSGISFIIVGGISILMTIKRSRIFLYFKR